MKKQIKSKSFRSILDVLKSSGYVDFQAADTEVDVRLSQLGEQFAENVRQAFLAADHNNSIFRVRSLGSSILGIEFKKNFDWIKQNFQNELPLVVLQEEGAAQQIKLPEAKFTTTGSLSQLHFIKPTQANQLYFKMQRQRKIWWMRYASNPGGLVISDTKDDESVDAGVGKAQLTNLNYKFGFGDIDAEQISLITLAATPENDWLKLRDSDTGRKLTPAIIKSTMSSELAALLLLTDGVDSSNDHILHINRKLAPFQIFIYRHTSDDTVNQELQDLSQYVATILRKASIRTLNLPKFQFGGDKVMQKEIIAADKLGVPYIIVLNDDSLKNGLLKLRNRETRICETIHVTDVPNYLLKIFSAA
jgi:DNA polymerase gamma 2